MELFTEEQKQEIIRQYSFLQKEQMKMREYGTFGYYERDDYHRDYTRILYSSSFRRLQGKMQILGIEPTAFFRNRLTHSLEVSQIAHSIAVNISRQCNGEVYKDDLFLIDAAALAHDIGHPAFGHKGERVLDRLARKMNPTSRFEGNAQNFRVLRILEKKEPMIKGLNLTNRTLLAINKYIVRQDNDVEKFMYGCDYDYLDVIRMKTQLQQQRTLDVQIIELADDIAYSVHDLEDGLAFRNFSIDELLYLIKKQDEDAFRLFEPIVIETRDYARKANTYGTIQEYSQVFRKRLTSRLTNDFINDVTLENIGEDEAKKNGTRYGLQELRLGKYKRLCSLLSKTIFDCVTRDTNITIYEKKGGVILENLYKVFSDKDINKHGKLLPPDYRPHGDYTLEAGCIDYLAGMMDTFAISLYREFYGTDFDDIKFFD